MGLGIIYAHENYWEQRQKSTHYANICYSLSDQYNTKQMEGKPRSQDTPKEEKNVKFDHMQPCNFSGVAVGLSQNTNERHDTLWSWW
jgi:hypothetical protein